ncbi:hypothetical protein [Rhodopseudomonas sp. RCAM05734]|uniref:hypothetical protein n=1 Tax=Rhodopseudomonas sp. RCAM05734 TaxID=3457549 RepID=UPI004043B6B3
MTALTIKLTRGAAVALLAAGAISAPARAQDPWSILAPAAAPDDAPETHDQPAAVLDLPEPDWSLLDTSTNAAAKSSPRQARAGQSGDATAWTSQNKADGSAALSVKQQLVPFWDARIGADMNVARSAPSMSTSDMLRQKYGPDGSPSQSGGTAWAAVTAPGVGSIWDKTAIEARIDPGQDQSKLATSLSKSMPLAGDQYSLTLQNGYNVVQQAGLPVIGFNGRPTRSYETDQSAKLRFNETGTSLVAGQSLSTVDEKWLRKVGAEQQIFGGVNISATVSETLQGPANKSLTAGFKHRLVTCW